MRLIDADVLKRRAITVRFFGKDIMMVPTAEIDDAPTIDPVRHGEWIEKDASAFMACSVCGHSEYWGFLNNYCPNCGARMDGGNMERPCDNCQEWDCYGCDYKQTERSE